MEILASISMLGILAAPLIGLVWMPIWVGSKTKGKFIFHTYGAALLVNLGIVAILYAGMNRTCSVNQSECLGGSGAFYLSVLWIGFLAFAGAISAFFNHQKWRSKAQVETT
jgi:NO-binding membrane sensor protein with MHYT domain